MRICLVGPIATADIRHLLDDGGAGLPAGYTGAPLTAVLLEELMRQGHEVVAVTTDNSLPLDSTGPLVRAGPGLSFQVCPARRHAWRPNGWHPGRALDLFRFERAHLRQAISNSRADIVHAHWTYEFAWAALDSGLPCVVTCHDSPPVVLRYSRSPYRALRYLMAKQVLARARHLTAVSDYMASEVARLAATDALRVVPNPVAGHVFAHGRVRRASTAPALAMVCNGWGERKNPKSALRAFALYRRTVPQASLHCFGNDFGPDEAGQRWAVSQGLADGLHFRGQMPHKALVHEVARMDALLHPALEESFGVVIAEAMAMGLPVVAGRDSGAVGWVMDDGRVAHQVMPGVLTEVRKPEALAAALHTCFDEHYEARSAAGLLAARARFSVEAVAAAYVRLYQEVRDAGVLSAVTQTVQELGAP